MMPTDISDDDDEDEDGEDDDTGHDHVSAKNDTVLSTVRALRLICNYT